MKYKMNNDLNSVMHTLKTTMEDTITSVPLGTTCVYLDIPLHMNIGDQLIHRGTEAFLKKHGIRPRFYMSAHEYHKFRHRIRPGDVILLHGGGNMNDLYPLHENLRQQVLKDFPDNRIVVLPQSIHFEKDDTDRKFLAAYRKHRHVTVFARDRESYDRLQSAGEIDCRMCPDMAHALWRSGSGLDPCPAGRGTLLFLRDDVEAARAEGNADGIDWLDILSGTDRLLCSAIIKGIRISPTLWMSQIFHRLWNINRDRMIEKCRRTFAAYDIVETDRLHGMIFSCLLGKTVVYHDNSYGKLSRYAAQWLADAPRNVMQARP